MNREVSFPLDAFDFLWLEVTPRCNLACTHCYADSSPHRPLHDVMQPADWMAMLDEASDLGCRRAQFIGGEPTLYPALGTLIHHARSRCFTDIEVYTNGTVLTNELKDVFVRFDVDLAFSVYAAQAELHDDITRHRGSWTKTIATIRWALDAGLRVRAAIVAMNANRHQVDATQRLLQTMGVGRVGADGIRGIGRGSREVARKSPLKELCGACGRGQLCVSSDGQIYPCVFSHFHPVGQIETGLASAVRSDELQAFRSAMRSMRGMLRVHAFPGGTAGADCQPERPAPDCAPEKPAPPCGPEKPAPPCRPERDPGPCNPERA
jgi:MoaA/NifB/PqqE/SkfB family radical SAM enzyme